MALLLYCIMEDRGDQPLPVLRGVNNEPVFWISGPGLRAAVSAYVQDNGVRLAALMAFRDVVEACQGQFTIIPMRFGSVLPDERRVLSHLMDRRKVCEELLGKLRGCVEMGIRVPDREVASHGMNWSNLPGPGSSGRSFLVSRKACYELSEKIAATRKELADHCRRQFSGLYRDCKVEPSPVLSLYFLTPAGLVHAFRQAFERIKAGAGEKLLLSGPWPPYNFVTEDIPGWIIS